MSSAPLVQEDVLPLEICINICSFVETHGLYVLTLMNRMWNQAATIALYEHIDLIRPRAIWRCIKTLSRPPEALSFGRDLTIYPKSIRIRYPMLIYVVDQSRQALADILISTLPRLINIRFFSCAIPLPRIPRILLSFAAGRTSLLRTLDLMSQGDGRMVMEVNFDVDLALDVLTFSSFELTLPVGGPTSTAAYASFLKRTICHSPHALRVLSLNIGSSMTAAGSPIVDVISRLPILPHLEELSIPEAFLHFPCFAQAPRLKSLTYYANADLLGSTDYSTLEVLACSSNIGVLEAFLPNVQTRRRPIHTLRLDRACYERHGDLFVRTPMTAADTLPVLAHMAYSGVPVRHLAIGIPDTALSNFSHPTIAPFLGHLESLVLAIIPLFTGMRETYENDPLLLSTTLLPHTPRLHTLLLSDAPTKFMRSPMDAFPWARDESRQREILAEFDRAAPALQRVALTNEFEWEKRADGRWHAWGHVDVDRHGSLWPYGRKSCPLDDELDSLQQDIT